MTNDNLERMYIFIELFVFILWDNNRKNASYFRIEQVDINGLY